MLQIYAACAVRGCSKRCMRQNEACASTTRCAARIEVTLEKIYTTNVETEFGVFRLAATSKGIVYLDLPNACGRGFPSWVERHARGAKCILNHEVTQIYVHELQEYFAGTLRKFTIPLDLRATIFQRAVYRELQCVPYGKTCTYGELAAHIGNPKAMRAVGTANAMNPIPIIIPCHRVVAAGGKLGGYAGGRELKERLLALESKQFSLSC